jgi:triacylglycerol lipase
MTVDHVRHHIVLVPGFIGFDALGQLEYYSGVTERFVRWSEDAAARGDVALHYFDNIPTASVELRAERLRNYLIKKTRRGEFGRDDRVALVGHSTGGLDIRKALHDLSLEPATSVDGATPVEHAKLLARCQRLAFLSTPQFGTTLADFWSDYQHIIRAEAKNAGLAVQLNRDYIADLRHRSLERYARTELELAIVDVLNESDERGGDNRQRTEEREARAELGLWLEHIGRDFQIIEDLRSRGSQESRSPAHFGAEMRRTELQRWQNYGVKTRSYATCVSAAVQRGDTIENVLTLLRLARPFDELLEKLNRVSRLWAAQPLGARCCPRSRFSTSALPSSSSCFMRCAPIGNGRSSGRPASLRASPSSMARKP